MPSLLSDTPPHSPPLTLTAKHIFTTTTTTTTTTPTTTSRTGSEIRSACRSNHHTTPTSGHAPTYLQANLIILPSLYAPDFRLLCARNPVPCPLIAESLSPGRWDAVKSHLPQLNGAQILHEVDIRTDAPKYNVYADGKLVSFQTPDILDRWTDDYVAFLIGCSFSFESALADAGLPPKHTLQGRNVPMYKTTVPLCAAGVFRNATYVVSMRPYRLSEVEKVRDITRKYEVTHGEPLDWGWDAVGRLGIRDVDVPEFGDAPVDEMGEGLGCRRRRISCRNVEIASEVGDRGVESEMTEDCGSESEDEDDPLVPVFWGCGVTPQNAVMQANLKGVVMSHAPGHMLVLDCRDTDIVSMSDGDASELGGMDLGNISEGKEEEEPREEMEKE